MMFLLLGFFHFTFSSVPLMFSYFIMRFFSLLRCRQMLLASEIMVCIGILLSFHIIIPYTVVQYVSSGLIMFVSAEVLEGEIFYIK